jgi:hypothetical protein
MGNSVVDVLLALIAAAPGTIAAISSLRNGRKLTSIDGGTGRVKKRPKKNGQHPDWYRSPDV